MRNTRRKRGYEKERVRFSLMRSFAGFSLDGARPRHGAAAPSPASLTRTGMRISTSHMSAASSQVT